LLLFIIFIREFYRLYSTTLRYYLVDIIECLVFNIVYIILLKILLILFIIGVLNRVFGTILRVFTLLLNFKYILNYVFWSIRYYYSK